MSEMLRLSYSTTVHTQYCTNFLLLNCGAACPCLVEALLPSTKETTATLPIVSPLTVPVPAPRRVSLVVSAFVTSNLPSRDKQILDMCVTQKKAHRSEEPPPAFALSLPVLTHQKPVWLGAPAQKSPHRRPRHLADTVALAKRSRPPPEVGNASAKSMPGIDGGGYFRGEVNEVRENSEGVGIGNSTWDEREESHVVPGNIAESMILSRGFALEDDEEPEIDVGNDIADEILRQAGYSVKSFSNASDTEQRAESIATFSETHQTTVDGLDADEDQVESTGGVDAVVEAGPGVNVQTQLDFERQGHCALPDILDAGQVKGLAGAVDQKLKDSILDAYHQKLEVLLGPGAVAEANTPKVAQGMLDKAGIQIPFLQLFNLHETVPEVNAIVRDSALGRIAADLLGVDAIRLYQDSVFWKRPGDGPTPYHADLSMMPLDTNHAVTFFIPLRALPGGKYAPSLRFASGSHRDLSLMYWYEGVGAAGRTALNASGGSPPAEVSDLSTRYPETSHGAMKLGSATAHHGFTLHSSPGIPEDSRGRVALSVCYIAADARVLPKSQQRLVDAEDSWSHRRWLKKSKAGKPVKHSLLPVVFSRSDE